MRSLLSLVLPLGLTALVAACGSGNSGSTSGGSSSTSGGPSVAPGKPAVAMPEGWKEKAASYLEARTGQWLTSPPAISNTPCATTCHTTFPYLLSRHAFAPVATPKADEVRNRMVARVNEGAAAVPYYGSESNKAKMTESWATEAVLNAAALAMTDIQSPTAAPGADANAAYQRLWATQNAEGTWAWLEFGLFPWETRLDWGAAISVMMAARAGQTSAPGYAKAVSYIKQRIAATTNPVNFHDRIAVLWANGASKDLLSDAESKALVAELAGKQLEDGGFSVGTFGIGKLAASRAGTSDGYATAIATLALCSSPGGTELSEVRKAITWLAENQSADGSWVGRSVNKDVKTNNGFMTDAATAYAVLAVHTCNVDQPGE
jgi:hypothetical protein